MQKVSVIIPIYNAEMYLRECFDSIIDQTLEDIEIICINDGSTDSSLDIVKEYAGKDGRIIIIDKQNEGVAIARNLGIDRATGEYVCFMDSDDYYPSNDILEELYNKAKKNNVLIAGGEFSIFNPLIVPYEPKQEFESVDDGYLFAKNSIIEYKDYQFDYGFHRFIYNRNFLVNNNIYFPNYVRFEDPVFLVQAMCKATKFYALDRISYAYRGSIKEISKKDNVVKDTFLGIADNLEFAKLNNLNKLKNYTVMRFYQHYMLYKDSMNKENKIICTQLLKDKDIKKIISNKKFKRFIQSIFSIKNNQEKTHKVLTILGIKLKIKKQYKISKREAFDYIDFVLNQQLDKSNFVEQTHDIHEFKDQDVKLISFYLPQFHDFDENVKWFGKGFTEWSNTSKAVPQFIGHYQPHIPIDVGYYNLNDNFIMQRQIELAKQYGVYGFSFYYYWFSGEKLMEKPLERFLQDKSLNIPFFLFWANEDWTMLWDNGKDREVLHKQELLKNDEAKFMNDILPYMKDDRYIKIDNKPLLIIYNPHNYQFERFIEFNNKIRQIAKEHGFKDLYIMTTTCRADDSDCKSYKEFVQTYRLDSLLEFFPQGIFMHDMKQLKPTIMNKKFKGQCLDMHDFITNKKYIYNSSLNLFKCAFPHWDNTSRKCYNGADIYQNTPNDYKTWLKDIINWTKNNYKVDEQFVFINAWNEWAEGAHLEPDKKYGYAYLQATKEALEETYYENKKS